MTILSLVPQENMKQPQLGMPDKINKSTIML
jgi:hypothetical protein